MALIYAYCGAAWALTRSHVPEGERGDIMPAGGREGVPVDD